MRSWIGDLMHATLPAKIVDSFPHLAAASCSTVSFSKRVFLPNDLIELRRLHSGLLQLLERLSGIDGLMLPRIADEDHAVSFKRSRNSFICFVLARLDSSTK